MPRSPLIALRLDAQLMTDLDDFIAAHPEKSRSAVIVEALQKFLKSKAPTLKRGRPATLKTE